MHQARHARRPLHRRRALLQAAAATLAALAGAVGGGHALAQEELRHLPHPHLGRVSLLLPQGWGLDTRLEAVSGTLFIVIRPPAGVRFDLQLAVNEISRFRNEALARRDLDAWLAAALAEALPQSVEGRVSPKPFGLRREEARYASLTDRAPPPGDFSTLAMGLRLTGPRAAVFTLYAEAAEVEAGLLQRVLDCVASITYER